MSGKIAGMSKEIAMLGVTTQERDVINLAKGWARALEEWAAGEGKTFDDVRPDLTASEVRLYQAVLRLRRSEGARHPRTAREPEAVEARARRSDRP